MKEIDESKIFIENLTNVLKQLTINKIKFNKALEWPANKVSNITKGSQAPLISDFTAVRKFFDLDPIFFLTKVLTPVEIENLSDKVVNIKNERNTSRYNSDERPILYIIVLLSEKYDTTNKFTKRQVIDLMPSQFANYSIEWEKTRLKDFVKKIGATETSEHIYQLSTELPMAMIQEAINSVGKDWLSGSEDNIK
ncbi:hypothetical protein [Sphingobacterium kitahiroshimense]|uniref:XRE family transcriptional regulator n=1 Tax=Sphingobacterium kitahiroshimense TaxID=470446 RepID=A0ABV0BVT3_9SPHI